MDERDPLTRQYFNGRIDFDAPDMFTMGGQLLDTPFAAKLTGAPDGSRIVMHLDESGAGFEIHNSKMFARKGEFLLHAYNAGGFTLLTKERLELREKFQHQGIGLRMFAQQAFAALDAGVRQIWLTALRAGAYNGYYAWARYGFDAELEWIHKQSFPPAFQGVRTLSELMATANGRDVWRAHGTTVQMCFELNDPRYFLALQNYMRVKGVTL
jgi:GNAT superfamily N-acetyltransferase